MLVEPIDQAAQTAGEIFGLHFTGQDERVVILPVKGYTPKQIAEAMQISLSSVRKHLQPCAKRVKAKSAEDFQQMIRWGIDAGQR